jgi:hypothetical protein
MISGTNDPFLLLSTTTPMSSRGKNVTKAVNPSTFPP